MQYLSGMEKLIVGIEEINLTMPPRGNARVVEEGQGVDSVTSNNSINNNYPYYILNYIYDLKGQIDHVTSGFH